MKKQTVFISGLGGFLGSHVADMMLAEGHTVIGCDNFVCGDPDNVPRNADLHEYDLIDFRRSLPLLKHVDVVVHTAAAAYDGLSFFSPHFVTQNVYGNTVALAAAAMEQGVRRFVFFSSMARYGEAQVVPFSEDHPPRPLSPYGVAKLAAEDSLRSLCRVHGMEWVVCVPHNIIGPRQRYDDPFRNVAAIMINRILQGQAPVIYGDGEQKRCFSFVQDSLQVLDRLVFSPEASGQVVNVGPDEELVTVRVLAETILRLMNSDLKPIYLPARPEEARMANCSAQKARKIFGYRTQYTLERGLSSMIDWIRSHGPKPFRYHVPLEIKNARMPTTWLEQSI